MYTQLRIKIKKIVMTLKQAVIKKVNGECAQRNITINPLANTCGLTPSTVYSFLDNTRKDIKLSTIKKICDGLNITLCEFFNTDYFSNLEQEIK